MKFILKNQYEFLNISPIVINFFLVLAFPLNLSYDTSSISQIGYVSIVRSLQHFIEQTSFHSLFELTQTNEYVTRVYKLHNLL